MTSAEVGAVDPTDAFAHALSEERLDNGRRLSWLRFIGVSGVFALTVVLGAVAAPSWYGNLGVFALYWVIAAVLLWYARRPRARLRFTGFDIALVDMPLAFLLLRALFIGGPDDRGTAGFSIGFYVLLGVVRGLGAARGAILL